MWFQPPLHLLPDDGIKAAKNGSFALAFFRGIRQQITFDIRINFFTRYPYVVVEELEDRKEEGSKSTWLVTHISKFCNIQANCVVVHRERQRGFHEAIPKWIPTVSRK